MTSLTIVIKILLLQILQSSSEALNYDRSHYLSLVFSSLQCLNGTLTTSSSPLISDIHHSFNPESHISEYKNLNDIKALLQFINKTNINGFKDNEPFTNSPVHIGQMSLILNVLYENTEDWDLFFNTTVWLINRVNDAQLYWALMVTLGEKFTDSVITPTVVEVFPQLFVNKKSVLGVAGIPPNADENVTLEEHPLQYWTSDPGLNEFHVHWHIDNPFWWNETLYGVERHRKGELFLYMHKQIVNRYNAERLSNGLFEVTPLELDLDYKIPEAYYPDVVNINYMYFPIRKDDESMRYYDNGENFLQLKTWHDRLITGIDQGYFLRSNGTNDFEYLHFENGTTIVGATTEASTTKSANAGYYGSFHNFLHRFLAGTSRIGATIPGIEAHPETAMRDPVFFQIHKTIDSIYDRFKSTTSAYTRNDLEFPGIWIQSLEIQTPRDNNIAESSSSEWPFTSNIPVLKTYFTFQTYDISTAARPCRDFYDKPILSKVKTLSYEPFNFILTIKSTRKERSYGMVRIFMWPEYDVNGKKYNVDESNERAIELDRFPINIEPERDTLITRSSLNSSLTRLGSPPAIKQLNKPTSSSTNVLGPEMGRACGFPNNLLIPKGTVEGSRFRIMAIVTHEPRIRQYPNFPLCGTLNGIRYPDERPMGFPFDRPGTRFLSYDGICSLIGGCYYKNVKDIRVIVRHKPQLNLQPEFYFNIRH